MNETPTVTVHISRSGDTFFWVVHGPAPIHRRIASGTSATREGAEYAATMEARLVVPDFNIPPRVFTDE